MLKRLLPLAKVAASLIPVPGAGAAVRAGLNIADRAFTRKGVAGHGLGALYAASDGSLYQLQAADGDELDGLYDQDAMDGVAADDELGTVAADDQLDGEDATDQVGDPEPGVAGDDAIEGYVRDVPRPALQGYMPERPAETRMFNPTRESPDPWKPLW